MKAYNRIFLSGLFALVLCAPVFAHEPAHGDSYPKGRVTGNLTLWGDSAAYSAWSGNLSLGTVHVHPAGYVSWLRPSTFAGHHGAYCRHGARWAHGHGPAKRFTRGHGHGHWERHSHEIRRHH